MEGMTKNGFGRCVAAALSLLAVGMAALAFPRAQEAALGTWWLYATAWALLAACGAACVAALCRRRWVSAAFHAGAAAVVVGAGLTAGQARNWEIGLVDSPIAPPEYKTWRTEGKPDGDPVELVSFAIDTYGNGMPRQFRTRLRFPEGVREVSVNAPLRRKGLTYYQMSYGRAWDPYGRQVWQTFLRVRKDPGAPVTFAGYGLLAAAALAMAVREARR